MYERRNRNLLESSFTRFPTSSHEGSECVCVRTLELSSFFIAISCIEKTRLTISMVSFFHRGEHGTPNEIIGNREPKINNKPINPIVLSVQHIGSFAFCGSFEFLLCVGLESRHYHTPTCSSQIHEFVFFELKSKNT